MFDTITLVLLWFFTAGVSFILWLIKEWPGGIYWFWAWNTITIAVALWELYLWKKYRITLTRLITKAETDQIKVVKHRWVAKLVVLSYFLGGLSFCVHLWLWR